MEQTITKIDSILSKEYDSILSEKWAGGKSLVDLVIAAIEYLILRGKL